MRRRRHVAEPGARGDAARLRARGRAASGPARSAATGAGAGRAGDARRDEADAVVGEVREQRVEPARLEPDVGVDEGDERRRRPRQAGVAGDGRSGVGPQPQHPRAGDGVDRRIRRVVDGDHGGDARAAAHDLGERRLAEHERRHDDGDVGRGERRRRRARVDRAGVERGGRRAGRRRSGDVLAGGDALVHADAGRRSGGTAAAATRRSRRRCPPAAGSTGRASTSSPRRPYPMPLPSECRRRRVLVPAPTPDTRWTSTRMGSAVAPLAEGGEDAGGGGGRVEDGELVGGVARGRRR